MSNISNQKITRRDAIKLLGASVGAGVLANLPAKWTTPELSGGNLPAHAQTSDCPAGTSSMFVEFLYISDPRGVEELYTLYNVPLTQVVKSGTYPETGYTILFQCISGCVRYRFFVDPLSTATIRVTINGLIFKYLKNVSNVRLDAWVNGSTGETDDDPIYGPASCFV